MSQLQIYNASAGSGKTYTLVKEYLKILLSSDYPDSFKQILAITFTNKAVNEMKQRVVKNLYAFASEEILSRPSPLFGQISEELKLAPVTVHQRAKSTLKKILFNYAFFDIVTIDKFNHRLLRTFAFDLKLPVNFEVSLDTGLMLEQAVDNLLQQAGEDELLTKVLIDFALDMADEDKSWDITEGLKKTAKMLLEENHAAYLEGFEGYGLAHFYEVRQKTKAYIKELAESAQKTGNQTLKTLHENNLSASDFSRGTLYYHFQTIATGEVSASLYNNKLEKNIAEGNLYVKNAPQHIKETINGLQSYLMHQYQVAKNTVYKTLFFQNLLNNLTPLSLLNAVNHEFKAIQKEENSIPIANFNNLIGNAIAQQPAPFIYERLGEKYRHYFIDEFQDTSSLQWQNLIPLISNALAGETLTGKKGSLLLVGDAKQAIYRWRGGKAEQFMGLYGPENPFHVEKKTFSLESNYRSLDEIIHFNNAFFGFISGFLTDEKYKALYKNGSFQKSNKNPGGYISIDFFEKDDDETESYCQRVYEIINELEKEEVSLGDICILVRRNEEVATIAHFLAENNIKIVSSEALLIKNNPEICFLENLLHYLQDNSNEVAMAQVLHYLGNKAQPDGAYSFWVDNKNAVTTLFANYGFIENTFWGLSLFNGVQYAIACFCSNTGSDAYLQYFLELIFEFSVKSARHLYSFLSFWEEKKSKLSIVAPLANDAVQIMTIHKAKGLEFPVVIYPFANSALYNNQSEKMWLPMDDQTIDLPYGLLNKNKNLLGYNEEVALNYHDYEAKQQLDAFNLLYVAVTRPVEQLYILTRKVALPKESDLPTNFSQLFMAYLIHEGLWQEGINHYGLGQEKPVSIHQKTLNKFAGTVTFAPRFTWAQNFKIITKAGSLWGSKTESAIERGNLLHLLLADVITSEDVSPVVASAVKNGFVEFANSAAMEETLNQLVRHPSLKVLFNGNDTVLTEKDIFTEAGETLRPDRLNIHPDQSVTIIDYKTGVFETGYELQLNNYSLSLGQMGFTVQQKLLVFINNEVQVLPIA